MEILVAGVNTKKWADVDHYKANKVNGSYEFEKFDPPEKDDKDTRRLKSLFNKIPINEVKILGNKPIYFEGRLI